MGKFFQKHHGFIKRRGLEFFANFIRNIGYEDIWENSVFRTLWRAVKDGEIVRTLEEKFTKSDLGKIRNSQEARKY